MTTKCTCPDCKCESVFECFMGKCGCKTCIVPTERSSKIWIHKKEYEQGLQGVVLLKEKEIIQEKLI